MRLLVDSHVLIWFLTSPDHLSPTVTDLLKSLANDVLVSAVTAYEIELKRPVDPLLQRVPVDLEAAVTSELFAWLPVTPADAIRAGRLPLTHRDPWDRLLAAQALGEGIPLVSADRRLDVFGVERIW